jgi:DNA-binding XRE family transcriptional regulator
MSGVLKSAVELREPFHLRLRAFRASKDLSRAALASELGVTPTTLLRWETGSTRPSSIAAARLQVLGFGDIAETDTSAATIPRLNAHTNSGKVSDVASALRNSATQQFVIAGGGLAVLPAPFVRNGAPDQTEFHQRLLELQVSEKEVLHTNSLRRLSLVECVEGVGPTAQHTLERPRSTAVSWNSNYGVHGWHRYVGRFPPHVVRALLNSFGASSRHVVLDPFVGSGTTAVECRLLGIPFVGIEICALSCLMTRTKAAFPDDLHLLPGIAKEFSAFYPNQWHSFLRGREPATVSHEEILARTGNGVPRFPNIERWFSPEALLGVSITLECAGHLTGFSRDALLLALSARMRSIGNVDVDVVRAEYRKVPRQNVDVQRLVLGQLKKMALDIAATVSSHQGLLGDPSGVKLYEGSVLDVDLPSESIDHVVTSPPYGVEAISYLRTHLLSYRSLIAHLGHDPYQSRDKTIGSEYIDDAQLVAEHRAGHVSGTCRQFFEPVSDIADPKILARRNAMIQFFDDMLAVGERLAKWMRDGGKLAFVVGNKRLAEKVIPTDLIIRELFASCGFQFEESIRHKLKTNNSNSQVPWQERTIQEEYILLFSRQPRR